MSLAVKSRRLGDVILFPALGALSEATSPRRCRSSWKARFRTIRTWCDLAAVDAIDSAAWPAVRLLSRRKRRRRSEIVRPAPQGERNSADHQVQTIFDTHPSPEDAVAAFYRGGARRHMRIG